MKRCIPLLVMMLCIFSSCSGSGYSGKNDEERISFLDGYGIVVDTGRSYYSSPCIVPEISDSTWEIRNILSKDILEINLEEYKGKECMLYMYPVKKLPFNIKKDGSTEVRASIICYKNSIICSYIEFISELRTLPPVTLSGKSLVDITGVKWELWRNRIDSDGDKKLLIWQYYDSLRLGNYEDAYSYIYDKETIKKEDFIKAAKENKLLYIDFLDIKQYKVPIEDECYFLVKAKVGDSKGFFKKSTYEITFDLKRNPKEKDFGGWKIYKTKIK